MSEGEGAAILRLTGVERHFGSVAAVDGLSLTLEPGEFVTLLGPSGCGKTTALRLIAGFESPDAGHIHFKDTEVTSWSPQRRGFGMVFQNYALFPHLDVFENVAFGLRARKQEAARIREKVLSALQIVDLEGYEKRAVQALSGGQQQRVALARALAIEPPLLLLDEPLSNLDQALRVRTRSELRDLVKSLGITALFVTHDQEEAFDLSDRIAVMKDGVIRQIGAPRVLYDEPTDAFVAGFVGRANTLAATVEGDRARIADGVSWPISGRRGSPGAAGSHEPAREGVLLFRPEDVRFVDGEEDARYGSPLRGTVRAVRFRGAMTFYLVEPVGPSASAPGGASAMVEVAAPPGGPGVGSPVALLPTAGGRLHLFRSEESKAP